MEATMRTSQKHKHPELLSPVGDWDCLQAAVLNGADAVYLGVKDFNARLYSRNFTLQELAKVVSYAHTNGVKVYLTMNTLVKNHEVDAFFQVLSNAYVAGVDGVIIQHLSFLDIIKQNIPGLRVFISTQGAVGNIASALVVKTADRIILPRELPLVEIKKFIEAGINTEVFVHGALCFSYSGLCLFSSFVSSRSGNRGSCAQLCRQKYNGAYPLSTRELCLVRRLPELIDAGVQGFKIEGRMRSPLYVAVATRLYRKAIDSHLQGKFTLPLQEMTEMEVVFNREFTEGLVFNDSRLISPEKPMNRGAFLGEIHHGEVLVQRPVFVGDGIGIWNQDNITGNILKSLFINGQQVNSASAGESVNLGISAEDGARVYLTSSPSIKIKPDNEMKRLPIALPPRKKVKVNLSPIESHLSPETSLLVKAYSRSEAVASARAGAGIVFLDISSPAFPGSENWHEDAVLGAFLPRILNDAEISSTLKLIKEKHPGALLVGNPGLLPACARLNIPVYLDYSLNIFNDLDTWYFSKYHAVPVLSPELSLLELSRFRNKNVVVFCHGDIVLVNTMINPGTPQLIDEKGSQFRVRQEGNYWQILNSRPFGLFEVVGTLQAQGFTRFLIDWEGKSERAVKLYRTLLQHGNVNRRARKGYTSGHLYKPVT